MGKPPCGKKTGPAVVHGAEKILSNLLRAVLQGFCEKYLGRYHRNFPVACPFFYRISANIQLTSGKFPLNGPDFLFRMYIFPCDSSSVNNHSLVSGIGKFQLPVVVLGFFIKPFENSAGGSRNV